MRSERIAASTIRVAEQNPRVMVALRRLLLITVWGELAGEVAPVVVAGGIDSGAIPPDHMLSLMMLPEELPVITSMRGKAENGERAGNPTSPFRPTVAPA